MPRKKRPTPLEVLLGEPLVMLSLGLVVVIIILPWFWRIVLAFTVLVGVAIYIWYYLKKLKEKRSIGIEEIDAMDGAAFEKRLAMLFHDLGYSVKETPYRGDWGADLIIAKQGILTVVQAKRYAHPVGVQGIQEVVTARAKYNCGKSMVVTNNTFTTQARELAHHNGTELWDRERLMRELQRVNQSKR